MDARTLLMMQTYGLTQQTLDMVKAAVPQDFSKLEKVFNVALGLVWYDLEPTAKLLYPVLTPLRNMIPRVMGAGGEATNWKQITAINANNLSAGVSEGNRSGRITTTANNKTASYKGLGLEDYVTFEADYAAKNFDDVKALAVLGLLRALMIQEEKTDLYGFGSFQINSGNACPTPTAATSNLTGNLTANTVYHCKVVPLTPRGYELASISGGIVQTVSRTNADGTNDTLGSGTGKISAANNANASNKTTIRYAIPAANLTAGTLKGAAGYAWYTGPDNANANLTLTAITTVPYFDYKGNETQGTQTANDLNANDHSNDSLVYDGIWAQICAANSGAYYRDLAGNNLSGTNGVPEITEIETALKSFWDNYRLSPDILWCSSQEIKNMVPKIIGSNGVPVYRIEQTPEGLVGATAGATVAYYLNRYSMSGSSRMAVRLHPNMPPGSMMFHSTTIPYPLSNVPNLVQKKLRREYYQIEWPIQTRSYEYGVYMDGLLQCYFPAAFGLICGINDG